MDGRKTPVTTPPAQASTTAVLHALSTNTNEQDLNAVREACYRLIRENNDTQERRYKDLERERLTDSLYDKQDKKRKLTFDLIGHVLGAMAMVAIFIVLLIATAISGPLPILALAVSLAGLCYFAAKIGTQWADRITLKEEICRCDAQIKQLTPTQTTIAPNANATNRPFAVLTVNADTSTHPTKNQKPSSSSTRPNPRVCAG
jgi:hypothetical protein